MAIYYVRPDGNDANNGLSSSTAGAWQTITKAIGASGIAPGDTLYIAPGAYRGTFTAAFTNPTSEGQRITISGDPTASQFSGIAAGDVLITNYLSDTTVPANGTTLTIAKNYVTITKIRLQGYNAATNGCDVILQGGKFVVNNCVFESMFQSVNTGQFTVAVEITQSLVGLSFYNNFVRGQLIVSPTGTYSAATDMDARIYANTIINTKQTSNPAIATYNTSANAGGLKIYNNILIGSYGFINTGTNANTTYKIELYNNQIFASVVGIQNNSTASIVENYNNINATAARTLCNAGANSIVNGRVALDLDYSRLVGIATLPTFAPSINGINRNAGTNTYVSSTDFFGVSWLTPSTPTIGSVEYSAITTAGQYNPTERNASTITIAPGSTSQSIELYLGVTGLTASTSGLSAYYNRTRSADVQIPLVARNITQNWTSGGFAEVNANTMPGVYRLDIPNEALAAGADDVTVVVRGASGTNGAVMSIKLSSGGLTTAQTASAVWDAATTSYTNNGSFGLNLLRADQQNKQGLVTLSSAGNVNRVDSDVHAIANDIAAAIALKGALNHDGTGYVDSDVVRISTSTAAANELEGALLHNGTDYIDSNLLSGNSTRVFVGRFQLTQTGTTQGDIIEAFTTDTPSFELQLFDGDNNIVPVTGATLGLRILDVTSTVVETGTPTIEYGTGGIVRWTAPGSYVSIGCPAGMYRLFVDRTVSGTTTTFGPLQIKVQVQ